VNCILVPCATSHTEIGNFPQPRPWKQSPAKVVDSTRSIGGYFGRTLKQELVG
jgi:hypothetical protein